MESLLVAARPENEVRLAGANCRVWSGSGLFSAVYGMVSHADFTRLNLMSNAGQRQQPPHTTRPGVGERCPADTSNWLKRHRRANSRWKWTRRTSRFKSKWTSGSRSA